MFWINNPQFEDEEGNPVTVSADFVVAGNCPTLMGNFQDSESAALDTLCPLPDGVRYVGGTSSQTTITMEDLPRMKNSVAHQFLLGQLALEGGSPKGRILRSQAYCEMKGLAGSAEKEN